MPTVDVLTTAAANPGLLAEVRALLDVAFEGDFSPTAWEHALGGHHVVACEDGEVVAHAALVGRTLETGGRHWRTGYVEAVATVAAHRGRGLGSQVMTEIGTLVRRHHELGALATGRHGFYGRLGWERWLGPTFARHGPTPVRTGTGDDALMVLRFGPSRDVDRGGAITCDGRAGHDW